MPEKNLYLRFPEVEIPVDLDPLYVIVDGRRAKRMADYSTGLKYKRCCLGKAKRRE